MRAGERLLSRIDGKEVLLFPLEYMNVSQDEGGSYSHSGTYNMDFLGWGVAGRVINCPYYAPCSCKLVGKSTQSAYNIWESLDTVHTPLGVMKVTFWVMHDEDLPYSLGDELNQGDYLGSTGNAGQSAGDHLHLNVASGAYVGQEQVPPDDNWQLINSQHIYQMMYVNDTTIVNGAGHNWLTYNEGYDPTVKKRKRFNWILYTNKIRNERNSSY